MQIETQEQWNALLTGCQIGRGFRCCPMPTADWPRMAYEQINLNADSAGFVDPDDTEWTRYKQRVRTISDSYSTTGSFGSWSSGTLSVSETRRFTEYFSYNIGGLTECDHQTAIDERTAGSITITEDSEVYDKIGSDPPYLKVKTSTRTADISGVADADYEAEYGVTPAPDWTWKLTKRYEEWNSSGVKITDTTTYEFATLSPPPSLAGGQNLSDTYSYSEPIDDADLTNLIDTTIRPIAADFVSNADCMDSGEVTLNFPVYARMGGIEVSGNNDFSIQLQGIRWKWRVPDQEEWGGKYFKVTWDEVFFPQSYLDWYQENVAYFEAKALRDAWEERGPQLRVDFEEPETP